MLLLQAIGNAARIASAQCLGSLILSAVDKEITSLAQKRPKHFVDLFNPAFVMVEMFPPQC